MSYGKHYKAYLRGWKDGRDVGVFFGVFGSLLVAGIIFATFYLIQKI